MKPVLDRLLFNFLRISSSVYYSVIKLPEYLKLGEQTEIARGPRSFLRYILYIRRYIKQKRRTKKHFELCITCI